LLRVEERHERLKKTAADYTDRAVATAVETILEATGETDAWLLATRMSIVVSPHVTPDRQK
jgi:hypothetical protein